MKTRRACPCGGDDYKRCCRAFHRGEEPPDPARLVRSRFSAFALGEGEYLWRTLHEEHPLRAGEHDAVVRDLSRAHPRLRYRALAIHHVELDGDRARVLYTARIFERGRDRSFVELAEFARTSEGWRYRDGVTRPSDDRVPSIADFA